MPTGDAAAITTSTASPSFLQITLGSEMILYGSLKIKSASYFITPPLFYYLSHYYYCYYYLLSCYEF